MSQNGELSPISSEELRPEDPGFLQHALGHLGQVRNPDGEKTPLVGQSPAMLVRGQSWDNFEPVTNWLAQSESIGNEQMEDSTNTQCSDSETEGVPDEPFPFVRVLESEERQNTSYATPTQPVDHGPARRPRTSASIPARPRRESITESVITSDSDGAVQVLTKIVSQAAPSESDTMPPLPLRQVAFDSGRFIMPQEATDTDDDFDPSKDEFDVSEFMRLRASLRSMNGSPVRHDHAAVQSTPVASPEDQKAGQVLTPLQPRLSTYTPPKRPNQSGPVRTQQEHMLTPPMSPLQSRTEEDVIEIPTPVHFDQGDQDGDDPKQHTAVTGPIAGSLGNELLLHRSNVQRPEPSAAIYNGSMGAQQPLVNAAPTPVQPLTPEQIIVLNYDDAFEIATELIAEQESGYIGGRQGKLEQAVYDATRRMGGVGDWIYRHKYGEHVDTRAERAEALTAYNESLTEYAEQRYPGDYDAQLDFVIEERDAFYAQVFELKEQTQLENRIRGGIHGWLSNRFVVATTVVVASVGLGVLSSLAGNAVHIPEVLTDSNGLLVAQALGTTAISAVAGWFGGKAVGKTEVSNGPPVPESKQHATDKTYKEEAEEFWQDFEDKLDIAHSAASSTDVLAMVGDMSYHIEARVENAVARNRADVRLAKMLGASIMGLGALAGFEGAVVVQSLVAHHGTLYASQPVQQAVPTHNAAPTPAVTHAAQPTATATPKASVTPTGKPTAVPGHSGGGNGGSGHPHNIVHHTSGPDFSHIHADQSPWAVADQMNQVDPRHVIEPMQRVVDTVTRHANQGYSMGWYNGYQNVFLHGQLLDSAQQHIFNTFMLGH